MPAASATASRNWGSRSFCPRSAATVTGSSAERCRCTSASRAASVSRARAAAAAVRSAPTRTATAASAAARSASSRASGADEDAQRKSLRQTTPSADTMIVSAPSAPWAIPASRSRSTDRSSSSRVPSDKTAASASDSAWPFGSLVTSAASLLGPNRPTRQHLGHQDTGPPGHQGQVRLVLDLLQAIKNEGGP